MRLIIGLFWHTREQWNFNQDVVMVKKMIIIYQEGWTRWCRSKEYSSQCRGDKRWGFSPWVGRAPRVGSGNPLQYSWGGNSMDRGAWRATVHGVTESWTWPSTHTRRILNKGQFDKIFPFFILSTFISDIKNEMKKIGWRL